jgi:hypothetical protein
MTFLNCRNADISILRGQITLRTTLRDTRNSRQIVLIGLFWAKYARRIFAIVSTTSIPNLAPVSPTEATVDPPSRGSRLDADHPENGVLIPCLFTLGAARPTRRAALSITPNGRVARRIEVVHTIDNVEVDIPTASVRRRLASDAAQQRREIHCLQLDIHASLAQLIDADL